MSRGRHWRLPNPGEDDEMGRGRQRAKDAKIARQLKYANNGSDLRALERELVSGHSDVTSAVEPETTDTPVDPVEEWGDDEWEDETDER